MMRTLEIVRDALAAIPGVASSAIGLEANISPADYPLIRIVPTRIVPGRPYMNRTAECTIYFGVPIANSEGMEAVYADLFELEQAMLRKLHELGVRYIDTVTDEDRLDTYKLMALRVEIQSDARVEGTPTDLAAAYAVGGD